MHIVAYILHIVHILQLFYSIINLYIFTYKLNNKYVNACINVCIYMTNNRCIFYVMKRESLL